MPRGPIKQRTLSPKHQCAVNHLNSLFLVWQLEDPQNRARLSNEYLAAEISKHYQDPTRKIGPSGFGAWRNGKNIPDLESIDAIIDFFNADVTATYIAFGHEPPPSFGSFYKKVEADEQAKYWDDRLWILIQLDIARNEPLWESGKVMRNKDDSLIFIRSAWRLLQMKMPDFHEHVHDVAQLISAHEELRKHGL